jgi:hypothetical protein
MAEVWRGEQLVLDVAIRAPLKNQRASDSGNAQDGRNKLGGNKTTRDD